MTNFLIKLNSLLAALKKEDIEKYNNYQKEVQNEPWFKKIQEEYSKIFGSNDRIYIDSEALNSFQLSEVELEPEHEKNLKKLNRFLLITIGAHFNVRDADSYIEGFATNGSNKRKKIGTFLTDYLSERVKKALNYLENDLKDEVPIDGESFTDSRGKPLSDNQKIKKYVEILKKEGMNSVIRELDLNELVEVIDINTLFNQRQGKQILVSKEEVNFSVVISKSPEDVAGMSTDRRWTSCMKLPGYEIKDKNGNKIIDNEGGKRHDALEYDIKYGTLVAYLIKKEDIDIKDPIARIAIKPFHNIENEEEYFIAVKPENSIYSDGSLPGKLIEEFRKLVYQFCNKVNKDKFGVFVFKEGLYDDSGSNVIIQLKDKKLEAKIKSLIDPAIEGVSERRQREVAVAIYKYFMQHKDEKNNILIKCLENGNFSSITKFSEQYIRGNGITNCELDIPLKFEGEYLREVKASKGNFIVDTVENSEFKGKDIELVVNSYMQNSIFDGGKLKSVAYEPYDIYKTWRKYNNTWKSGYIFSKYFSEYFESVNDPYIFGLLEMRLQEPKQLEEATKIKVESEIEILKVLRKVRG
jgi:hypothetical protein